jgi:hypothetical protein
MLNGWSFSGPGGLRKSCEAVCATDSEWAGVERGGGLALALLQGP